MIVTVTLNAALDRSLTVPEFCTRHNVSRASYYKLRRLGLGPDEMRMPGTCIVRITPEADRAWRERMTELSKSEAVALEARRRQQQAVVAATASADSDKHVSRRNAARKSRPQRRARR